MNDLKKNGSWNILTFFFFFFFFWGGGGGGNFSARDFIACEASTSVGSCAFFAFIV